MKRSIFALAVMACGLAIASPSLGAGISANNGILENFNGDMTHYTGATAAKNIIGHKSLIGVATYIGDPTGLVNYRCALPRPENVWIGLITDGVPAGSKHTIEPIIGANIGSAPGPLPSG